MVRLRDVLSDAAKDIRYRRNLINIHITFLGWIVEFSGYFIIVLGAFILGHSSSFTNLILQSLTISIYFNVLPLVFLINDSELKEKIAEHEYYLKILRYFNCQHSVQIGTTENEEQNARSMSS